MKNLNIKILKKNKNYYNKEITKTLKINNNIHNTAINFINVNNKLNIYNNENDEFKIDNKINNVDYNLITTNDTNNNNDKIFEIIDNEEIDINEKILEIIKIDENIKNDEIINNDKIDENDNYNKIQKI